MRGETAEMLHRLSAAPLLAEILSPIEPSDDLVRVAKTWTEAVQLIEGEVWTALQLQVKNRLAREVREADFARSQAWNAIAGELRAEIVSLLERKTVAETVRAVQSDAVIHSIRWDLLSICMETEFSDLVAPRLSVPRLLPWYERGRLPCGWDGPVLDTGWRGELIEAPLTVL